MKTLIKITTDLAFLLLMVTILSYQKDSYASFKYKYLLNGPKFKVWQLKKIVYDGGRTVAFMKYRNKCKNLYK